MTSDVSLIFSYLVLLDIRYLILEINFNIRFSRYSTMNFFTLTDHLSVIQDQDVSYP